MTMDHPPGCWREHPECAQHMLGQLDAEDVDKIEDHWRAHRNPDPANWVLGAPPQRPRGGLEVVGEGDRPPAVMCPVCAEMAA